MAMYLRSAFLALAVFGTAANDTSASSGSTTYLRGRQAFHSTGPIASRHLTDSGAEYELDGYFLRLDKTRMNSPEESLEVAFKLPAKALATKDHSEWTIGIFGKRANPQDGALTPITSLKLCGRVKCLHEDIVHDGSLGEARVTFNDATAGAMEGQLAGWPLSLTANGDGFDVFLLDDTGSAVLGPITFTIDEPDSQNGSANVNGSANANGSANQSGKSTLTTSKTEYEKEEPVTVSFALDSDILSKNVPADMANWRIGLYMRHANPQDGGLPPIVSIPLCGKESCDDTDVSYQGDVVFTMENIAMRGEWPLDLNKHGTGYDVYILNKLGEDKVGPHQFNVIVDESAQS